MILLFWSGTIKELLDFTFSKCHHLKFAVNCDYSQIKFLDIFNKEQDKLATDLYRKLTDKSITLHYKSFHPSPQKKGLPMTQFNRIHHISGSDESYNKHSGDMMERFRDRQ